MAADLNDILRGRLPGGDQEEQPWQGPDLVERAHLLDDPVAYRQEAAMRALRGRVANGEFALHRLPPVHPRVQEWIDLFLADPDERPWLVLYGPTGCGKTTQLVHILHQVLMHHARQNRTYRWGFVTHREFSAATRNWSGGDPEQVIEDYMQMAFLATDDLGDYNDSAWAADCISRLIGHRVHHRLPLVVTTNLLLERGPRVPEGVPVLADTLDPRIISRLKAARWILVGDTDHRAAMGERFS